MRSNGSAAFHGFFLGSLVCAILRANRHNLSEGDNIMKRILWLIFTIFSIVLMVYFVDRAITYVPTEGPANGQNYYCPGRSTADVVQLGAEIKVRFICDVPLYRFDVTFPAAEEALNIFRSRTKSSWGRGVVLNSSGELLQLYSCEGGIFREVWPPLKRR